MANMISILDTLTTRLTLDTIKYKLSVKAKDENRQLACVDRYCFMLPKNIKLTKPFIAKNLTIDFGYNRFSTYKNVKLYPINDDFLKEISAKNTLLGIIGLITILAIIGSLIAYTLYFTIMAFFFFIFCIALMGMGSGGNNTQNGNFEGFGKALITGMGLGALGTSL